MRPNERGIENGSEFYSWHPSEAARKIFLYPVYLGHYFCSGDYEVKRKYLDSYLMMYIRSGSGTLADSSGVHRLAEGDFVLLDCFRPHRYFTRSGWEIYWVHFDGATARGLYQYAEAHGQLIVHGGGSPVLRRFSQLLEPFERQTAPNEVILSKQLNDLMTELLLTCGGECKGGEPAIEKAIRYMGEHMEEKITLETLARHVSMSPFYFAHVFKETTGTTPHQYLTETRLDYARYLLRTEQFTVQNIAARCGFANGGAFCTSFKKYTGCSPREYRDQNLQTGP